MSSGYRAVALPPHGVRFHGGPDKFFHARFLYVALEGRDTLSFTPAARARDTTTLGRPHVGEFLISRCGQLRFLLRDPGKVYISYHSLPCLSCKRSDPTRSRAHINFASSHIATSCFCAELLIGRRRRRRRRRRHNGSTYLWRSCSPARCLLRFECPAGQAHHLDLSSREPHPAGASWP